MTKPYKCRVEYLEGSGNQYIDIGFKLKNTHTAEVKLKTGSTTGACGIFGSRSGAASNNFSIQIGNSADLVCDFNNSNYSTYRYYEISSANREYTLFISKNKRTINGTGNTTVCNDTIETPDNGYLFGVSGSPLTTNKFVGNVYYCKILDGDTLVRDFIPVLDNSGRPAMYDQVSGQLFYNQGSGEFTYGRQIIPVEYLESTGTQYIDTGVKGKNNLQYKTKINYTNLSTSASNGIGGEYLGNASAYIGMVRANGHFTYLFNNTAVETTKTFYANTDYVIDSTMNNGSQIVKVNNETISTGTLSGTFTSTRNIFLYAICSTNDAADVYGSLKIYYLQIYDNGVLVRDFTPCIDENLVPFMFDKVHNTVYLNEGTGQFKVGPNVEKAWGGKKLRRKLALALANLKKKRRYYTEIEYLETTNQQSGSSSTNAAAYIDTGIIPNNNTRLECRMQFTTLISGQSVEALNGTTGAESAPRFAWGFASISPYTNFYFGLGAQNLTTSVTRDTNVHTFVLDAKNKTCSIDDTTNSFTSSGSVESTRSIYLFARHTQLDYVSKPCNAKIYYCKIYDNETIVRDFIPVLDWNYVPCLYDKVSGQLFYSQGTLDFTAGREIHPVEYLESTGTQYINTGLLSTASSTVDTEFGFTSMEGGVANNVGVFGGRNATTTNTFTFFKIASATPQYFRFDYNGQPQVATASDMTWNTSSKYRFQYNGTNCITTNTTTGESAVVARSPGSTFTQYPIHLFAVNTAGTIGQNLSGRIYYYKYSDGTKSVDMVPAIDENGVGFMFDRVSHTCFLNAGQGSFKYPAREVEYLTSDGNQYIDTGIQPTDNYGYRIKNTYTYGGGEQCAIGCMDAGNRFVGIYTGGGTQISCGWGDFVGVIGNDYEWRTDTIWDVECNYKNNRIITVRGVSKDVSDIHISGTISSTLYLFARHYGSTITKMQGKVYGVEITNGSSVVYNFIPCFKDGVACMVDKLTGTAYLNQGTGSFSTGRIVEPEYE